MFYSPSDMAEFERRALRELTSIRLACWCLVGIAAGIPLIALAGALLGW